MIFLDSSYLIALTDSRDQWHGKAVRLIDIIREETAVSDIVIYETLTAVGARLGGKAALKVYYTTKDNSKIFRVDEPVFNTSLRYFLRFDGKISIADCVSVALMKKEGISTIVSFDSDFDKFEGIKRLM